VKLPKSKGFDSIYVVVNRFTKMAHFIPTTEKASEDDLIDLHMRNVWKLHGMPLIHSTNQHGNFTLKYIRKMFKALGIEQRFSTAYHPQTQGQVENLNGWLETYLQMFCDHQKRNWASLLHSAEFAWNNHYHSSLRMTPFYANSGMHPTTTDVPSIRQTDMVGQITRIHKSRELVKALLERAQEQQKVTYNQQREKEPVFAPSDKVYLSTENLIMDKGSKKLSDLRTGPFEIIGKVGEGAYKLKLLEHMKVNPTFNVSLLTRARPNPIDGRAPTEPAPVIVDGHKEYTIDKFIALNWLDGNFQYKISWKGYGKESDEWIYRENLLKDLGEESLLDFEKEFYDAHPTAVQHTNTNKTRVRGKRGLKRK
jgi:hypothetical protein